MCCCGCELALAIAKIQASGSTDAPEADIRVATAAPETGREASLAARCKRFLQSRRRWIFSPVLKSFAPISPAIGSTNG